GRSGIIPPGPSLHNPEPLMTEQPVFEALPIDCADFGPNQAQAIVCTSCRQPLTQSYYDERGRVLCSACLDQCQHANDPWGGTRSKHFATTSLPRLHRRPQSRRKNRSAPARSSSAFC